MAKRNLAGESFARFSEGPNHVVYSQPGRPGAICGFKGADFQGQAPTTVAEAEHALDQNSTWRYVMGWAHSESALYVVGRGGVKVTTQVPKDQDGNFCESTWKEFFEVTCREKLGGRVASGVKQSVTRRLEKVQPRPQKQLPPAVVAAAAAAMNGEAKAALAEFVWGDSDSLQGEIQAAVKVATAAYAAEIEAAALKFERNLAAAIDRATAGESRRVEAVLANAFGPGLGCAAGIHALLDGKTELEGIERLNAYRKAVGVAQAGLKSTGGAVDLHVRNSLNMNKKFGQQNRLAEINKENS